MTDQTLIDKYLPEYTFKEFHEIVIDGPIEETYKIAQNFDLSKSKLITILFKIRGLPTRRMNLEGFISDMGFSKIEERFPTEHLMGFWATSKIKPITRYEDFINNSISAKIKVVWNFSLAELTPTRTRVGTETRILCMSPMTKAVFGLYWLIIKPFSGVIRKKMLRIIKQDVETTERRRT